MKTVLTVKVELEPEEQEWAIALEAVVAPLRKLKEAQAFTGLGFLALALLSQLRCAGPG